MNSTPRVNKWGDVEWVNERGELHREERPAVIHGDGSLLWYKNGRLHREGGPAVIEENGSLMWYRNGRRIK